MGRVAGVASVVGVAVLFSPIRAQDLLGYLKMYFGYFCQCCLSPERNDLLSYCNNGGSKAPFGSLLPTWCDNCSIFCTNSARARMDAAATAISDSAWGRCSNLMRRFLSSNASS